MNERLNLEQSQKTLLHLSPQQVQYVRMLEMNTAEIEDKVRHELDENPALEALNDTETDLDDGLSRSDFNESADQLVQADYKSDEDMPYVQPRSETRHVSLEINPWAQTMGENLLSQLSEYDIDDTTRNIAAYIIGNLDNNGRLTRSLSAIADDLSISTGEDITPDMVTHAFEYVRSLDPPGVGAVDLRDCLLLQLERRAPKTLPLRIATDIIQDHFDEFSNMHYDKIKSRMGISSHQLKEAADIIRSLNPKPGNDTSAEIDDRLRHITPDFYVEPHDDGSFSISLTQRIPELAVEETFRPDYKFKGGNSSDPESVAFIKRRRDEAEQFINLLRRRDKTLMDVMKAIVSLQHDFFATEDPSSIRPMILKDVAALTGLDLSVISRATSGKYMATPASIYPLKMFFNERPREDSDTTSHQILETLKEVIDNEDGHAPLSDEAIKKQLALRGLDIARRTVTKYRERLGIPSARLRRKI